MADVQHEQGVATMHALAAIPPFPPIAIRLLRLASDEDVHLHRIVELIRADPGFSSEVLQLANSPLHALIRQVDSLQQALVVIGLDGLKRLVVTVASRAYAKNFLRKPELHRCWRHMLACGLLSEEIARACAIDPDQAYTAGLMHDAGRLGLLAAFPDEYAGLLRDADREGAVEDTAFLLDRERETFGLDHCDAGQELAEKWGLPETFALIAGRHHDRHYGAEFALLDVVAMGCRLADSLGFDVIHTNCPWSIDQARGQLPERARPRFWTDQDALRTSILEHLENLDPGHAHLDRRSGRVAAPEVEQTPSLGGEPRPIQRDDAGLRANATAEAQNDPDEEVSNGGLAATGGCEQCAIMPRSGPWPGREFNWAPVVLVAAALVTLLALLLWDPLRAG